MKNVSVLVGIGVNEERFREILGVAEGAKEDKAGWLNFLRYLSGRGLQTPELVISDACLGLVEALEEVYPHAMWQRCIVHLYRNVLRLTPTDKGPGNLSGRQLGAGTGRARLRHIAGSRREARRYLRMDPLETRELEQGAA